MSAANRNLYRLCKDVTIPKGNRVIFVSHQKVDAYRLAHSIVRVNPDMLFEWTMSFDDALACGLIEKIEG
jgi:hypothetical protein